MISRYASPATLAVLCCDVSALLAVFLFEFIILLLLVFMFHSYDYFSLGMSFSIVPESFSSLA